MRLRRVLPVVITALVAPALASTGKIVEAGPPKIAPHVVVATLDTGINPFHPTWHRKGSDHPSKFIPGFPKSSPALRLALRPTYLDSVAKSRKAFEKLAKEDRHPYWIPGTNIIGTWAHESDQAPIFDTNLVSPSHSHGAQASSQIAGRKYGLAPDVYLVVVDRTPDGVAVPGVYEANAEALRWAADQPWIDIIHTNIQNVVPLANENMPAGYAGYGDAVTYAVENGKLVVSAGGNYYAETTETSPHAGPPGVLVAGANDNCGYAGFSNPDPHVVMDGVGTLSAAPDSFEEASFSGTSSSSPRITGYAASLLLRIREALGYTGGIRRGALVSVPKSQAPTEGPLADGSLTAAELHEVIRKTADPNPHESTWDGSGSAGCIPQPSDLPFSFYPKMGYGEVSEHTLPSALDVVLGAAPMPERMVEDMFYEVSEELRRRFWSE